MIHNLPWFVFPFKNIWWGGGGHLAPPHPVILQNCVYVLETKLLSHMFSFTKLSLSRMLHFQSHTPNKKCAVHYVAQNATLDAFISILLSRSLRVKQPSKILMNLCLAYILFLIAFMAGSTRTEPVIGCQISSFLVQYFMLSVFTWSLVEVFTCFRDIILPLAKKLHKLTWKAMAFGWGKNLYHAELQGER